MNKYISQDAAIEAITKRECYNCGVFPKNCEICKTNAHRKAILNVPAADVVPFEDYKHLLKVARAMHTWIFLNTCDEQKAYDECHLTDEDNYLLGYGGQFILAEGGGADMKEVENAEIHQS